MLLSFSNKLCKVFSYFGLNPVYETGLPSVSLSGVAGAVSAGSARLGSRLEPCDRELPVELRS